MKKVSVIIPVYNGEKYIQKCINSVLKQSYSNVEVIVINDGSVDKTEKILLEYENENKNLFVINKENTGVSNSRNMGLDKASGDYIMFVDSDDWLEEDAIEICVNKIKDADAIRFSHFIANDTIKIKKSGVDDIYSDVDLKLTSNKEILENLISNKTDGHLWNYMFRSEVIKNNKINFDEELFYLEDVVFLIEVISKVGKVNIISQPLYNYYLNNNSVTKRKDSIIRNLSSIGLVRKKIIKYLKDNKYKQYISLLEQRFLNLQLMYFLELENKFEIKEFNNSLRLIAKSNYKYYQEILNKKEISKKWKILISLLSKDRIILLKMYLGIYKFMKKAR